MADPLSRVPSYMRGPPLGTRKAGEYGRYLAELKEGKRENMIDFLKEEGAFFYSLDEVLSDDMVTRYNLSDITKRTDGSERIDYAKAFIRTQAPNFETTTGKRVKEFKVTEEGMKSDGPIASLNSKGQSSDTKKKIWSVDIFGIPLGDAKSSQVAHLLPDEPDHAIEWYDVACWAMGREPSTVDLNGIYRLLHGTKSGIKRTTGSGVRHFVSNKVRINGKEMLLDKSDPQMLILPVRSRKQCLDWNGEGYDAIILMGTDKNHSGYTWATDCVGMKKTELMKVGHASKKELGVALKLMREMTYALVQSLVHLKPPEAPSDTKEDEKIAMESAIKKRSDRIKVFTDLMRGNTVQVPTPDRCLPVDNEPLRGVCKITFSNDEGKKLHKPPDPLLVVARAAVVFSVRKNFRLRASAIAEDNYDWDRDATQFAHLERMARRRDLDQATEGMEVAAVADEESDDVSAVSLTSHSSAEWSNPSSPQREYHAQLPADSNLIKSVQCRQPVEKVT